MDAPVFTNAIDQVLAELQRVDLLLRRQIRRLRAAHLLTEDPYRGLCIPDEHVDALLRAPTQGEGPAEEPTLAGGDSARLALELARVETSLAARRAASREAGVELPLETLRERFSLEDLEYDALLLALAPEVDLKYETLFAYAQNDATRKLPTVDLVLKLVCPNFEAHLRHRAVLAPEGRLLSNLLIRVVPDPQDRDPPLLAQMLKVESRVAQFVLGEDRLDARLAGCAQSLVHPKGWAELPVPPGLTTVLRQTAAQQSSEGWVYLFEGPCGSGRRAAAEALCHAWGRPLIDLEVPQALADATGWPLLLRVAQREALLTRSALRFSNAETLLGSDAATVTNRNAFVRAVSSCPGPVFVCTECPWPNEPSFALAKIVCSLAFPPLDPRQRQKFWATALGASLPAGFTNGELRPLAERFQLAPQQIEHAARAACLAAELRPDGARRLTLDDLQQAAAQHSGQALRQFGRKVPAVYEWRDLVLPGRAQQQLREICLAVKHRTRVQEDWGFGRRLAFGRGVNVLFAGPSGTGKTMAAQVLARELGLDLYQIDLANVVSKYIGETEKHLSAIFRAAQTSNAILFFDEADALFGKRAEVKDAHDRYANLEVAYLLQKMEEYEGIVVLATNLGKNIDDAFRRRLHHSVVFPFPEAEHRERIWRGAFPEQAPVGADVDFPFLARQFELSGGNIRNIALAAAVFAAEEQGDSTSDGQSPVIAMRHLIVATARELQKMGKLSSRGDFGPHYESVREYA